MRVAVISDVHGNCLALEAVLRDIAGQSVDATLNLGDMVAGPMEPGRAAELLAVSDFPAVAGNHERYLTRRAVEAMGAVDRFARGQIEPSHLHWLAELPRTHIVAGEIFMCHGTPSDEDTAWLDKWFSGRSVTVPDEQSVTAEADGIDYPVLLCGHTHVPRAVRLRDGRLVINPGSVGLQMNYGSPDARYAIIERRGTNWSVMHRAIPYDHNAAAQQAVRNGFPRWKEALTTGWASAEGLF